MAGLLNINEMSALALHTLVELAKGKRNKEQARLSVADLAGCLHASQHTLHKVVTRLVGAGFIESIRGASGGIQLLVSPKDINVLQVIEAIEGKMFPNGCLFMKRVCGESATCAFAGLTEKLERQILRQFVDTTMEKLAKS